MKFTTLPRRVAATGAVTALAAGALVGLTTTSASAAPVDVNYTCPTPDAGSIVMALTTDVPALGALAVSPFPAGYSVPAGAVTGGITNAFTISDAAVAKLQEFQTTKIDFTDFAGSLGGAKLPADLPDVTTSELHNNGDGTWTFHADGDNLAFEMPAAGVYDVLAPAAFTIDAYILGGTQAVSITCTSDAAPGNYGAQITLVKNDSTTTASSNSPVKHGAKAVLKAKVKAPNHKAAGKVTFKDGKKKIGTVKLNKKGIAVLKKSLSKGKHKITMSYRGDGYTNPSSAKTIVKQK